MHAYQHDSETYAVACRPTAVRSKPARAAYSPRYEGRRSRSDALSHGAPRRRRSVHIGDDDVPGSCMPDHRRGHNADGACSGDQDIFAKHVECQSRVYRISEGVEDGRSIAIDSGIVTPDVCHRQRDVFSKRTGAIDAYS